MPVVDPDVHTDTAATPSSSHGWLLPAGLGVALIALLGGLLLGRGMAAADSASVTDEVSVGFLRDMKIHHAQAVRASEIIHRRSGEPQLNYLAFDILSTQQGQIGIMTGWLDLSRQSQNSSGPTMAWMGHSGPMPGLASDEQIEQLKTLPLAQAEESYLRLMIDHHRGALGMAEYAAKNADSGDVARLAQGMYDGQESEINLMQDMLAARGAAPQPAEADPIAPGEHVGH